MDGCDPASTAPRHDDALGIVSAPQRPRASRSAAVPDECRHQRGPTATAQWPRTGRSRACGACAPLPGRGLASCLPECGCKRCLRSPAQPGQGRRPDQTKVKVKVKTNESQAVRASIRVGFVPAQAVDADTG